MRRSLLLLALAVVLAFVPTLSSGQIVYAMGGASYGADAHLDAPDDIDVDLTVPVLENRLAGAGLRFWSNEYIQGWAGVSHQGTLGYGAGLQVRPFTRRTLTFEPYLGLGYQIYRPATGIVKVEDEEGDINVEFERNARSSVYAGLGTYYHLNRKLSIQVEVSSRLTSVVTEIHSDQGIEVFDPELSEGEEVFFSVVPSVGITYRDLRSLFDFRGDDDKVVADSVPTYQPMYVEPIREAGQVDAIGIAEPVLTQPFSVEPLPADDEMVLLPDGLFIMGLTDADPLGLSGRAGFKRITISQFYMDRYEVTNREYLDWLDTLAPDSVATMLPDSSAFERAGQRLDWANYFRSERYADHPVVAVTHEQATAFCESYNSRLPTEAEWEYAARGGELGNIYPWQGLETRDFSGQYLANYNPGGRSYAADNYAFTAPVGSFPPNSWGLYDMSGNVAEWVADTWNPTYSTLSNFNPLYLDETEPESVVRGGSWNDDEFLIGVGVRSSQVKDEASVYVGFRCARDVSADDIRRDRNRSPQEEQVPAPEDGQ